MTIKGNIQRERVIREYIQRERAGTSDKRERDIGCLQSTSLVLHKNTVSLSQTCEHRPQEQELKNEMWKLRQFGNHCKKYVELEKLGQFAIVNVKSFARFLVITVQTADNQVRIVYCAWNPYYKPNTTIEHICSNKNSTTFFHVTNWGFIIKVTMNTRSTQHQSIILLTFKMAKNSKNHPFGAFGHPALARSPQVKGVPKG